MITIQERLGKQLMRVMELRVKYKENSNELHFLQVAMVTTSIDKAKEALDSGNVAEITDAILDLSTWI